MRKPRPYLQLGLDVVFGGAGGQPAGVIQAGSRVKQRARSVRSAKIGLARVWPGSVLAAPDAWPSLSPTT
jgi:hypothetical protein